MSRAHVPFEIPGSKFHVCVRGFGSRLNVLSSRFYDVERFRVATGNLLHNNACANVEFASHVVRPAPAYRARPCRCPARDRPGHRHRPGGAAALARSLGSFQFGVEPLDVVTVVFVPSLWVSARGCDRHSGVARGSVDPVEAFLETNSAVPGSMFRVPGSCSQFRFEVPGSLFAVPIPAMTDPEPGTLNLEPGT
jgi:hypothetical protein